MSTTASSTNLCAPVAGHALVSEEFLAADEAFATALLRAEVRLVCHIGPTTPPRPLEHIELLHGVL